MENEVNQRLSVAIPAVSNMESRKKMVVRMLLLSEK
jgi:hypothetical protein